MRPLFSAAIVAALALSTLALAFFYGPSYNLAFLFWGVVALLVAGLLAGPRAAADAWDQRPLATAAALLALGCLGLQHAFASISAETSLAGAWLLGVGPLTFLVMAALLQRQAARGRHWLLPLLVPWWLVWLAVGLASYRLFLDGQRPFDPLSDASALACLLYLAWVPWADRWLQAGPELRGRDMRFLVASLVLLLVLFATGSRAGGALVVLAALYWTLQAIPQRRLGGRLAALLGVFGLAALLAFNLSTSVQTSLSEDLAADASTGQRLLLLQAAVDAFRAGSINGSGPLTFSLLYGALRSPADQSSGGVFVHNDYLQLLVEGGPWLLWPLLVLALVSGSQVLLGLLRPSSSYRFGRLGGWLAISLACAHAAVNFIVYTPALALALGALLAYTLGPGGPPETTAGVAEQTDHGHRPLGGRGKALWLFLATGGFAALVPLLIDATSLAVFSRQPDLLGSQRYRESPDAQRAYAQAALAVLPERGLPRLALALGAEQAGREAAQRNAGSAMVTHFNDALLHFRLLRQVDPWNTSAAERYARFLALREGPTVRSLLPLPPLPSGLSALRAGEHPEGLLRDALQRNPRALPPLAALVGLMDQQGRSAEAYALVKDYFGRWMENHLARRPRQAARWLAELERRARLVGDDAWAARAAARRAALPVSTAAATEPRLWFKRWLRHRNEQVSP